MAKKLLNQKELEAATERLRVATEEAKKLPKDSPEFDWIKKLPPCPDISGGKKVAVHIPKKRE